MPSLQQEHSQDFCYVSTAMREACAEVLGSAPHPCLAEPHIAPAGLLTNFACLVHRPCLLTPLWTGSLPACRLQCTVNVASNSAQEALAAGSAHAHLRAQRLVLRLTGRRRQPQFLTM